MKKTVWIARTAVCLALLIAIQFLTKSLGQLVTGSCVNLVLAIAALIGGVWSGVTVAVISHFLARDREAEHIAPRFSFYSIS